MITPILDRAGWMPTADRGVLGTLLPLHGTIALLLPVFSSVRAGIAWTAAVCRGVAWLAWSSERSLSRAPAQANASL